MFYLSIEHSVLFILVSVMKMYYPRIRGLREDADLTQKAVGEAINVPQRTYAYYESGQRMIPPTVLCALAGFYHTSVDYLVGLTDERKPYPRRR
jgi:transcriptional regulator with XRE-family HTH domain